MQNDTFDYFHGSSEVLTEITQSGVFGGIFVDSERNAAYSHGDVVHTISLSKNQILTDSALNYDFDYAALLKIVGDETGETGDELETLTDEVLADAGGWENQRLRGVIARELGFAAVEMTDEHGSTLLVLPGVAITH